ncbi:PIN domain-containing protein [Micromonospora sp. DT31]|uniref:PIN domain-containing protein n=1 Tax=Micromonospora sp. DT31 TaxID=3393434 RepID=UPI003CF06158
MRWSRLGDCPSWRRRHHGEGPASGSAGQLTRAGVVTPVIEHRALEVQMLLADRGQHRAPSIPDLLIAATAEKTGLTVLAADKDFDLIATLTGQPIETLPS